MLGLAPECSIAITTLPTALREAPEAKVLWLDAHGDYNTPGDLPERILVPRLVDLAGVLADFLREEAAALLPPAD